MKKHITNTKSYAVLFASLLLTITLGSASVSAEQYAVIINANNSYSGSSEAAMKDVRLFFLKEKTEWPSSIKAKAYGLKSTNDGQLKFNEIVLGMSDVKLTQHWLNKKQTEGETPPKALRSERAVIKLVAKSDGAFGIIPKASATDLPDTVKILFEF